MVHKNTSSLANNKDKKREIPLSIWIIGTVFRPFVRRWRMEKGRKLYEVIFPNIFKNIDQCKNKTEIENLLGKPKQISKGGNYGIFPHGQKAIIPDYVEIYLMKDYIINLWYKEDKLVHRSGYPLVSPWDIIANTWAYNHIDKKYMYKNRRKLSKADKKLLWAQDINIESFKRFLSVYFKIMDITYEEVRILHLYKIIKRSGKYKTIGDLNGILDKTEKARGILHEGHWYSAADNFGLLYMLVHPEARDSYFILPKQFMLVEKYKDFVSD